MQHTPTLPTSAYRRRNAGGLWIGAPRADRSVPVISKEEEAVLTKIGTSGQFTLAKTLGMYATVRRLSESK